MPYRGFGAYDDNWAGLMTRRIVWGNTAPSPVVCLLAVANVLVFVVTAHGQEIASSADLVAGGALTKSALQPGEQWRLIAAGFLHASVPHLLTNLLSLLACGPTLERRLGSTAFALVYVTALLGGSVASVETHGTSFIGVGASGAILGLLGALFALWVLGKIHLHPRFFFINFGLMGAINAPALHVDWAAHLGGFGGGLVSIALLDLLERSANLALRCRFPEFVKGNLLGLFGALGAALWRFSPQLNGGHVVINVAALSCLSMAFALLLDVLLSIRRGLAVVVVVLAACNGLIALGAAALFAPFACGVSQHGGVGVDTLTFLFCSASGYIPFAAAFAFSLLLYANAFRRGLVDVGFTSAMLMARRRRELG